jgi:hypothetical protein
VTYVSNLSRPRPEVRVGASKADERLYMSWRSGARKDADRRLAAKAGIRLVRMVNEIGELEESRENMCKDPIQLAWMVNEILRLAL